MEKYRFTLQEYLSLGYIYLLILGIISDVIYYKFLDIDILSYSAISDVLLSPVGVLTQNLRSFLVLIGIIGSALWSVLYLMPKVHQKYREKKWYRSLIFDMKKTDKIYQKKDTNGIVLLIGMLVMCMFIGLGIGRGFKTKKRLLAQDFEISHILTFSNQVQKEVWLVGQNSLYVFYALEGDKTISVSSINQNINVIQKLNEENNR